MNHPLMLPLLLLLAAGPTPDAVLERARVVIRENAGHITRFSCSQTIRRESHQHRDPLWQKVDCPGILAARAAGKGPVLQPASWDRMRLDVILSEGTETHSWPHGGPIEPGVFELMTARGSFATGDFAAFPISILAERAATIAFERTIEDHGAQVYVYRYRVSRERSRYALDAGPRREITPYSGELGIDAVSARLVKLTVVTDVLPRATGSCSATTTIEFNPQAAALMPRVTRLDAVTALGNEDANVIEYASCRAFTVDTAIQFDLPAAHATTEASAGSAVPPGKTLRLRLNQTIDSATAAAGDRISATVRTAVKSGPEVVIPTGATVLGRIVHFEKESIPQHGFWVLLLFEEVEIAGLKRPIRLQPPPSPPPELGRFPSYPLGTEGPPQVGRFWFANMDPLVLKQGWESVWTTW